MKSTLHLKFIFLYCIFGFLSVFITATLGFQLILNHFESSVSQRIYKDVNLVAAEILPTYFSDDDTLAIKRQLDGMSTYLEASLWATDIDGKLLASSNLPHVQAPDSIDHFNPAELGGEQFIISNYHGYFDEDVMTVIAPIVKGFHTQGYLLIHYPFSSLEAMTREVIRPMYIVIAVLFVLSFIFLLGLQFFVYYPLRKITEAATQYAAGNLEYEISITAQDELGYLSASMNYMAAQLKDMEDYQKKIVANVSHDFRSPLTSMKGYVEAMSDGTIPPELYGKYLNIISFETNRLIDLTNDLLTLNEFDTKELLLNKSDFDIQEMIKQTAASFEGRCVEKLISIELLLLSDPVIVYADPRKIQQVLYNLIDNAIKFSPNESTITIETVRKNEKAFISVKDNGIGIPKKDINKIWERFYKSDSSRGKDKKGTGLGLAIVKEAIQAHDEHINIVSTEGVGTEFIFSLTCK